jgi:hypothetical protein
MSFYREFKEATGAWLTVLISEMPLLVVKSLVLNKYFERPAVLKSR